VPGRSWLHPGRLVDAIRGRSAGHIRIGVAPGEIRRGQPVELIVTVYPGGPRGPLEVGLLCTEFWDEEESSGGRTSRVTKNEVAHEEWVRAEPGVGEQRVRLTPPREAPFSYDGEYVSFVWEAVAREHRPRRLDPNARAAIRVRP
jgi:hypothetical protein